MRPETHHRLTDRLGRPIRDLRISVTDRCNFRCRYCMPREQFGPGFRFKPRSELLTFEEVTRLTSLFAQRGVTKLRLTGGEPLLRAGISELVSMLVKVPGIEDVAMTTNGSLLKRHARALADAGLHRVTLSLDAIDRERFQAITDSHETVDNVLDAIDAADAAGLAPIKVNAVIHRGTNDGEILGLAERFRGTGHILRFIEYMDVGSSNGWKTSDVFSADEILERLSGVFPLEAIPPNYPGEVAQRFAYKDGAGEVGIIASVTKPFCGGCKRARLSADGSLFTCLFGNTGTDFRALLRSGASDERMLRKLDAVWSQRSDRYSEIRGNERHLPTLPRVEMSYIGG